MSDIKKIGVVIKPNATKHLRKKGETECPVDSIIIEEQLKEVVTQEIFAPRLNGEFPVAYGSGIGGSDRVMTNSCTTANILDPERFREVGADIVGSNAETYHYYRHNDVQRYEETKTENDSLPKIKLTLSDE
jgi:hypothetical protein